MSTCGDGCGSSMLEKVINHSAASAQKVMSHFPSLEFKNPSEVHLGSEKGVDEWLSEMLTIPLSICRPS